MRRVAQELRRPRARNEGRPRRLHYTVRCAKNAGVELVVARPVHLHFGLRLADHCILYVHRARLSHAQASKQASAPKSNTNCQRWAWWGFAIQCPTSTPKKARMLKKRTLKAWVWTRSRQNANRAGRKPCRTTTTPPQETTTTTSDAHAPSTGLCRTRRNQSKFSNDLEVKFFSWFVVATNAAMRTEPSDTFPVRISSRQAGSLSSAG